MKQDEARLRSLARQYNWLRERGESHEDTLQKLYANGGESIRPLLDKLKQAQQGDAKSDPLIAGRLKGLVSVLEHAQANESQRSSLLLGGLALSDELRDIGKTIRGKFVKQYLYMVVLCIVGIIASSIYAIFVYPVMAGMVPEFKSQDAFDVSFIFHVGMLGYPLIFAVLLLLILLICFFSIKSTFDLRSGKNFAAPMHFLPGLSALNKALKSFLHLGLQQLYSRSGFNAVESTELASKLAAGVEIKDREALEVAWKLDTLENEFAYQNQQHRADIEKALDKAASSWNTFLTVIIVITVYFMVSDYYAPLFRA